MLTQMRRLVPAAVNWTQLAYAFVLCLGIWSFAIERIQSDYRSTLHPLSAC
jgi:hypothetical protein